MTDDHVTFRGFSTDMGVTFPHNKGKQLHSVFTSGGIVNTIHEGDTQLNITISTSGDVGFLTKGKENLASALFIPKLSIYHLTKPTSNTLDMAADGQDPLYCHCAKYQEGMFLEIPEQIIHEDIPQDLLFIFKWARKNRLKWTLFHVSGVAIADLPYFIEQYQ